MRLLTVVWKDGDADKFGVPDDWQLPWGSPDPFIQIPACEHHGGIYVSTEGIKWASVADEVAR